MVNAHMPPPDTNAGNEFNYAVWTPGTEVTITSVPWNSDYRDIVNFDSQSKLDAYIDHRANQNGTGHVIDNMTYARFGVPVRLPIPFNDAMNYNYLRVRNDAMPISGDFQRTYYYFINEVRFVAPGTTELVIQLDVWQTFFNHVQFGNCYVERGHIGIANEFQMTDGGKAYLVTPEGLDIGAEYQIQKNYTHKLSSARSGTPDFHIMVVTTVAFDKPYGTVDDPKLNSATGSEMENLPNGAEIYIFDTVSDFKTFLDDVADKPWITQGIISVQAIPDEFNIPGPTLTIAGVGVKRAGAGTIPGKTIFPAEGWQDDAKALLPTRYRHLSKFLVYPYMVIELTTYNGQPLILKPEAWGSDGGIVMLPHFAPPGARLVIYPFRYNSGKQEATFQGNYPFNDGGEFLDFATGISDFPMFSVVNNGYMSFMASNRNGIAYQHQTADWSQQRTQAGIENSYNQASRNMSAAQQQTSLGIRTGNAQTALANDTAAFGAAQSAVNGVAGGIMSGNPLGIVGGAMSAANAGVSLAIGNNQRNQANTISGNAAQGSQNISNATAGYMRDSNRDYAMFASQGDYSNAIAGINAKIQDAKLTQPTTSGQIGGDAFNLAQYQWGVDIKLKMLQQGVVNSIGEFWLRYGYAINRFHKMDSLMVMSRFTYWKMRETYLISTRCPEIFKQAIRGIFEKGVTVWKNPDDIGTVDIGDNSPLEGVRL